ncbi:MAG: altronate dehydratase family protein, partial [Clostridiales Family XIII bacterium]|nr:altronate dehydratase family protein [Clostridiales Family XIII bacterium]
MKCIQLYPNDTVALATETLRRGDRVMIGGKTVAILDDIPNAHKFALKDFAEGEVVVKYDNPIGRASRPIRKGEWVHEHNLVSGLTDHKAYTYRFSAESTILPGRSEDTFMGYLRRDGSAGIRNYLAVIPTVSCANGPLQRIVRAAEAKYAKSENFDGVLALTHPYGCSQTGSDLETTTKILAGLVQNANFGGALLVSLGCEIAHPDTLLPFLAQHDKSRMRVLSLQDCGDEIDEGLRLIDELMADVLTCKRAPLPLGKLHIAMNCGGSDGHSGITANTLLGALCDTMVKKGVTMSMTEVPEMMGAEHILMNRAVNRKVFEDIVRLIRTYEAYFAKYGESAGDNPTQGNKAGGLTTLVEKALGCTQKGGHCAVSDVLAYGDRAKTPGFILISGPGNDLAGITGQIAAGAVLVIFTTGRGTPCGFAAPVFRLSSNTALAVKKPGWIDYDAGRLLDAADDPARAEALHEELLRRILDTANGAYATRSEQNG